MFGVRNLPSFIIRARISKFLNVLYNLKNVHSASSLWCGLHYTQGKKFIIRDVMAAISAGIFLNIWLAHHRKRKGI